MGNFKNAALGVATIAAVALSGTAQAACWSPAAADAAKVREFETMLMVSALRCRLKGVDFLSDYNRFIKSSRVGLTKVNDTLRTHFTAGGSAKVGLNRYDSFVTSLANRYGGGAEGLDCRDMKDITRDALATRGSTVELAALADRAGASSRLPGGMCRGVKTASVR